MKSAATEPSRVTNRRVTNGRDRPACILSMIQLAAMVRIQTTAISARKPLLSFDVRAGETDAVDDSERAREEHAGARDDHRAPYARGFGRWHRVRAPQADHTDQRERNEEDEGVDPHHAGRAEEQTGDAVHRESADPVGFRECPEPAEEKDLSQDLGVGVARVEHLHQVDREQDDGERGEALVEPGAGESEEREQRQAAEQRVGAEHERAAADPVGAREERRHHVKELRVDPAARRPRLEPGAGDEEVR